MTNRRFNFVVNAVFLVTAAALFYVSLKYLLPLILPFIIAFAVCAALQKPIVLLEKRFSRIPKKLLAALVIIMSLATIGTTAFFIAGALIEEIRRFINDIPALLSSLAERLSAENSPVEVFIGNLPSALRPYASELYSNLTGDIPGLLLSAAESLSGLLIESFGAIGSFAMRLPSVIIVIMITIVMIFFIGTDYRSACKAIAEFIPERFRQRLLNIKRYSADTVGCLLKTYAFLMLLTFTELAVGFALADLIGAEIPYIIPLALLTALVDILPVLGVGTVLIPWAIFDLTTGNLSRGIILLVIYAVVVIIRNFLEPKLVGQRFGLHPALTLLAIYTGGKLFGFSGVFLLPLTLIVAKRLKDAGAFSKNTSQEALQS